MTFYEERNQVVNGLRGGKKEKIQELVKIQHGSIERGEFLKRTAVLVGAVLVAASFGAIAGCGNNTAAVEQRSVYTETQNQGASQDQNTTQNQSSATTQTNPSEEVQSSTPQQTSTADCRFYNNGTCEKTGEACTHCIER
jgi:hypothetical protein